MSIRHTIPSRLARPATRSLNREHQISRVKELYRDWYRSAPEICALYALNVSPTHVRHAIREKFEENRYVKDTATIDMLLLKGRQTYQECMNGWMQDPHVLGILLKSQAKPQRTFMQKFLSGKDEDAVVPAAS